MRFRVNAELDGLLCVPEEYIIGSMTRLEAEGMLPTFQEITLFTL